MSFQSDIVDIKKLVKVLTGKETDVSITYSGTEYGVTRPWTIRCDSKEIKHETHDGGASELAAQLRKELRDKISSTERQASDLKKILSAMDN